MANFQVLVDSDAFVAWSLPDDLFHADVEAILARLAAKRQPLVTTSWVIAETATVLSHRGGQATARTYLKRLTDMSFPIIHITEELENETTKLFVSQQARGTSMVDCSNVVAMRRFEITHLLSFDKFYRRLNIKTIER